ncbi:hypothetical protein LSCP400_18031 [Ligilactobacillus salivarius cp400]|uniref:Uncharacterized protein n=1 Tax=Ligilactobacillus salivarius cp400 TaxID=1273133 RepID=V6DML7_9LACO|nr:hypothetical protein LSCP400_18031 [Ligilactobacillus salivarius cp400]
MSLQDQSVEITLCYNKKVHWLPPMHKLVLGADTLEGVL